MCYKIFPIAIYAALRYENDFDKAIIAAVNHNGDSDSTGSICGNILGAKSGLEGIASRWIENLELKETILEIGQDICDHCHMKRDGDYEDPVWLRKYVFINGLNGENSKELL